jgi:hypothetical protein
MGRDSPEANGAQQVSEGGETGAEAVKITRARAGANGPGWGGPANGPGQIGGPGRTPGVKNGEGKVAQSREALQQAAPLAIKTVIDIAANLEDPRALQAALAVLNRIGLHEKSGVELTGENGGAMITRIERVIIGPDEPEK